MEIKISVIIIRKVRGDYGWMSVFSPYPLTYKGILYKTCDELFQVLRFSGYPLIQGEFRYQKFPMATLEVAQKYHALLNRHDKWNESLEDLGLIKICLKLKLEQHPELQNKLIETGSSAIIVDGNTHYGNTAQYWGKVFNNGEWIGENKLGKLWMELRQELIKERKPR